MEDHGTYLIEWSGKLNGVIQITLELRAWQIKTSQIEYCIISNNILPISRLLHTCDLNIYLLKSVLLLWMRISSSNLSHGEEANPGVRRYPRCAGDGRLQCGGGVCRGGLSWSWQGSRSSNSGFGEQLLVTLGVDSGVQEAVILCHMVQSQKVTVVVE